MFKIPFHLLLLGGTSEAYALAEQLITDPNVRMIHSLAGRTANPKLPPGEVRIGGFGGVEGLITYLQHEKITAVIDATHPFAAQMGFHAAMSCAAIGIPLLRLERPAWRPQFGDHWYEVADWEAAVIRLQQGAQRVFLAIGRQELTPFCILEHVWFLIRSVDPPHPLPPFTHAEVLLAKGPFSLESEINLLRTHAIDTLVCKNSGGNATDAKLTAARALGIEVIMRQRPPRPDVPQVNEIAAAVNWLAAIKRDL